MSPDQFLKHWGFVALRTDTVRSGYVRATYADPGQRLNDGHHYQAESVEDALRGLHIYLQTRGLRPREVAQICKACGGDPAGLDGSVCADCEGECVQVAP